VSTADGRGFYPKATGAGRCCANCGERGHYAPRCTKPVVRCACGRRRHVARERCAPCERERIDGRATRSQEVLNLLEDGIGRTSAEVIAALGCHRSTAKWVLLSLYKRRLVTRDAHTGDENGVLFYVYHCR
jgi:hypothetical protein